MFNDKVKQAIESTGHVLDQCTKEWINYTHSPSWVSWNSSTKTINFGDPNICDTVAKELGDFVKTKGTWYLIYSDEEH